MAPDDRRIRRVVGIAGSLRAASWNRRLLEAARELAPDGLRIEPFDIRGIPLYDADLDTDEQLPDAVRRLKSAIADADGVLIASPEYNHTVPGVMQNVIDWSSRPGMGSPLAGKPVGIMGAANGLVGTARMQQVLKLTLLSTLARVMPHPGVVVGKARDKFDADGRLADQATRDFLAAYLRQFADWIDTVGVPPAVS
jgi:chromate reductase, NAD(P)H dehydrogenase (quinone)